MGEMVLAATQIGPRKIELREYPVPEIGADDALLKVEIAGICGSDIGGYEQFEGAPRIRGHENVGFIAKIGAQAGKALGRSRRRPRGCRAVLALRQLPLVPHR